MITFKEYVEWIERVREADPDGKKLNDFYSKVISLGREKAEREASDLERDLFLPPNPIYEIQLFENGVGRLVSEVNRDVFLRHAESLGLVKDKEYVQGGNARVITYRLDDSSHDSLYISDKVKKPAFQFVRFIGEDGKWKTYKFENPSSLWICAYDDKRVRTCHDLAQPFLELADENKIPSVITSREGYVGASNIPIQDWETKTN